MRTPWVFAAQQEFAKAREVSAGAFQSGGCRLSLRATASALWLRVARGRTPLFALRLAYAPDASLRLERARVRDTYNLSTSYGRIRVKIARTPVVRAQVWIAPLENLALTNWPRDLVMLTEDGTVHTRQRGLRSGCVYLSAPGLGSLMYFQNYSSLTEYFELTRTSPADRIGGTWPELGFALPASEEHPLPAAREVCISDVYLSLGENAPHSDGTLASTYFNHLADIYCALDRPEPQYHDWPHLAQQSLRDLSFSPECTLQTGGFRYLAPYVGDTTKPPESMVQLTVLLPMHEYAAAMGLDIPLVRDLIKAVPSFHDPKTGSLIRWPGERFAPGPPDVGKSGRYMDSWYLYHALFNLGRLVTRTNDTRLRKILESSLQYAIAVAQRFEYRWPVFFNLDTLEILRAEAREGAGGENDVCGLYALIMVHAYETFGDEAYLREAKESAKRLRGLGFNVAYQMNTTGFASEGMLRLYLLTGEPEYLDLSYLCLANVFDNMWLWECGYGNAKAYRTFFGMFPLPDAPYLAAYEELEASAKFREYLRLANDEIAPPVRLLLAEYCRHALDRAWYYFPRNLPPEALADHAQSGRIERDVAVPVEDLREGWDKCGQVGQEVYGAGVAPGLALRHYYYSKHSPVMVFCDYPAFGLRETALKRTTTIRMRVAGDARAECTVRVIPLDLQSRAPRCDARIGGKELAATITAEGHAVFSVPGNCALQLRIRSELTVRRRRV